MTMKTTINTCILSSIFLGICANMVVGQTLVTPVRVADINPTGASSPADLTLGGVANDHLFFRCDNGIGGGSSRRVWVYDLESTTGILTILGETPDYMAILGSGENRVFYQRTFGFGKELHWRGVNGAGHGSIFSNYLERPKPGCTLGNRFITAGNHTNSNPAVGDEPTFIDLTTNTRTLLRDIAPNSASSNASGFTPHNGKVYFVASNTTSGTELYSTDGTPAGTLMMKDIITGAIGSEPSDMRSVAGRLYFSALAAAGNREPWSCNGTTVGTVKLKEINASTTVGSDPKEFTALGTKVFFSANDGSNGRELWVTDGTATGTVMVKDIIAGASGSNPHDLILFNKKIWFVASDALGRTRSLYATDGTAGGTVKMLSLPANTEGEQLNVCNGKLFYVSRDATSSKMWCTDGTAKGTKQVQPAISPNINPIGTAPMAVMGNWLYFSGNFDATGAELWKVQ